MVTLPPTFVATKEPGYFWDTCSKRLFSIKTGLLKPIKYTKPNRWNHFTDGYRISTKGQRKNIQMKYLQELTITDSVIQIEEPTK